MYNASLLMLKLVYPFGSKTSKVLSNCVVKVGGHDLGVMLHMCTLLITRYAFNSKLKTRHSYTVIS